MSLPRRAEDLWPGLLALGVFIVALWAQTNALVGVFYDDGIYVVLAKALAEGEGYRYIHMPGSPPAVHYPFLYPAVLSLLWRVWPAFPQNVTLFQLFDAGALAVAAWAIAIHARRWGVPGVAQYVALPLGFIAFPLLANVGVRFSEPLFLALLASALLLVDRKNVSLRAAVMAGVLVGLTALTRSIGIAALVGIPAALWLRGHRRPAVVSAITAFVVLSPWIVWLLTNAGAVDSRIAANYGTYLEAAGRPGLLTTLGGLNLGALSPLARLTLPAALPLVWYPLAALLVAAAVSGAVTVARRVPALVATLAVYLLVVAFWPWTPDRFLWILVPWLALLATAGAVSAWRYGVWARGAVTVLALALLIGYGRRETMSLAGRRFARTAEGISQPFRALVPAIASELPADAVVASADEALIYLYTGRRSVPSVLFRRENRASVPLPPDTTVGYFCETGVTHLVLSGVGGPAAPLVDQLSAARDSPITPLFELTNGPALYRFRCPA